MTFVTINYGENHRLLFNPNCQLKHFIENIKTRCNYPADMQIELSDDAGNLKSVNQSKAIYANEVLCMERENLVLLQMFTNVKMEASTGLASTELSETTSYTPLLTNSDIVNEKFLARLNSRDISPFKPEEKTRRSKERTRKVDPVSTEENTSYSPTSQSRGGNNVRSKSSRAARAKSRGKR